MLKGKLLLVLTNGRSGSSMLCGLLHKHDLWVGNTKNGDWRNPDGFYENSEIYKGTDRYIEKKYGFSVSFDDGKWKEDFIKIIKRQGWNGQPLVVKHLPMTYQIWQDLEPTIITCRRDIKAQIKSRERINKQLNTDVMYWREGFTDAIEAMGMSYRVDYERLIKGDYSQLKQPLLRVGRVLDESICNEFIKPDYCHY